MNWIILIIAGLFEVGWAIGLKYTEGFTRLWPTVGTITAMIISLGLLGIAMKGLPVGTAYSIWVGVGAVGTVILGVVLLGESANVTRMISVALINRRNETAQEFSPQKLTIGIDLADGGDASSGKTAGPPKDPSTPRLVASLPVRAQRRGLLPGECGALRRVTVDSVSRQALCRQPTQKMAGSIAARVGRLE